jgi:heat shock protein HslJ
MKQAMLLLASLMLNACYGDETVRAYGAADKVWTLIELRDTKFAATATLTFLEKGRIAGKAPCNSFNASQDAPYPWFNAGPIASTRMACPELAAENAYFEALSEVTLSEVLGDTLILSNDDGVLLTFKSGG